MSDTQASVAPTSTSGTTTSSHIRRSSWATSSRARWSGWARASTRRCWTRAWSWSRMPPRATSASCAGAATPRSAPPSGRPAGASTAPSRPTSWCPPGSSIGCRTSCPDEVAVLAEPMAVTVTALRRGHLAAGDMVLIVGPGPVGLLAALAARASAAAEVVVAGSERRRPPGDGATAGLRRPRPPTRQARSCATRTDGRGADLVLEATGTQAGVAAAFDGVRRRGRIAAVGLSGRPSINVRWDFATTRDADLAFAMSSSYEAWEPAHRPSWVALPTQAATLPTYFPLADWAAAFQAVEDRTRGQGGHRPDAHSRECCMSRIVITDCDHPSIELERAIFRAAGHEVVLAQCRTADEVIAAGQGAVALLAQYAPITRRGHGRVARVPGGRPLRRQPRQHRAAGRAPGTASRSSTCPTTASMRWPTTPSR